MSKGNSYRKMWPADKFGWKYYCDKSARAQRKFDKHETIKKVRGSFNSSLELKKALDEIEYEDWSETHQDEIASEELDMKAFDVRFWGYDFQNNEGDWDFICDSYGDIATYYRINGKT